MIARKWRTQVRQSRSTSNLFSFLKQKKTFSALKFSATKSIFADAIRLDQKLSQIIFLLLMMTPFCGLVPSLIYSYITYFATDVGNAAFELPMPIWWETLLYPKHLARCNRNRFRNLVYSIGCRSITTIRLDFSLPWQYSLWCFRVYQSLHRLLFLCRLELIYTQ